MANEADLADHLRTNLPALNVGFHEGFVYFVRAGRTGAVKIGWARDVGKRISTLQTGSAHTLHLIGYFPGSLQDEQAWHDDWRELRIRGEWFRLTSILSGCINRRLVEPGATRYLYSSVLTRRGERF